MGSVHLKARTVGLLRFLREWAADPRSVGALAPSGAALAKLMTGEVGPTSGPVVELGAGTGVFTKALLNRGVAEADLTLFESNRMFAAALKARFPRASLIGEDAAELGSLRLPGGAGAVISGLPLLNFTPDQVRRILVSAFRIMKPEAAFFQFTYGMSCPIPSSLLGWLNLKGERIGSTLRNVPPASVFRISRRSAAGAEASC